VTDDGTAYACCPSGETVVNDGTCCPNDQICSTGGADICCASGMQCATDYNSLTACCADSSLVGSDGVCCLAGQFLAFCADGDSICCTVPGSDDACCSAHGGEAT
jgi:hypothetical protein